MKYVKMLGLAALAAMALMAFGAGTASAKVCSGSGTGEACAGSHGKVYSGAIKAALTSGKSAVLTTGLITFTCSESTAEGEVTGSTGAGSITKFTFGGCTNNINGGACTTSTTASTSNKWPAQVTTGTAPNGTTTVTNVTSTFTCNFLGASRTCNYTATDAGGKGEITTIGSATSPEIKAASVPLNREAGSDGLCSSTATWSGEYLISTPSSLYLT